MGKASLTPPDLLDQFATLVASADYTQNAQSPDTAYLSAFSYLNQEALYKYMKENPWLALNPDEQAFKDSMDLEAIGQIDDAGRDLLFPMDTVFYGDVKTRVNNLAPERDIELLYKEVYAIAMSDTWLHKEVLDSTQVARLREIANLCPFIYGRAVYAARVLVTYVDGQLLDYMNDCEAVGGGKTERSRAASAPAPVVNAIKKMVPSLRAGIHPNPNNGTFTVHLPKADVATLVLIDALGAEVYKAEVNHLQEVRPAPALTKGLYLYTLLQKGQEVYRGKMVVH